MRIRDATPADLESIVEANRALAAETEGQSLDPGLLRPGVAAALADPALGRYLLAVEGGRVLGQLMTTVEWSDWRNGRFLWIQSVYVFPAARGRGVFRALYRHVHEAAMHDGGVCGIRLYVDRSNAKALEVYGRLGMHRTHYDVMEVIYRGPESRG